jgi:hypothetical protein
MTPIDILHPEILRIIFLLLKDSRASKRETLASVCRSWRVVMLGIGEYWAKIVVKHTSKGAFVDYVQEYLVHIALRSGTHPLDIIWHDVYKNVDLLILDKFLRIAPTTRWKSLKVKFAAALLEDALGHGFPVLESLDIDTMAFPGAVSSSLISTLDESSPKLAKLSVPYIWELAASSFPNATRRIVSFRTTNDIFSTLPSNITDLEVDSFIGEPSVIFPSIKSLRTNHPFKKPDKVPNLESLTIFSPDPKPGSSVSPPFLKLTSLDIIDNPEAVLLWYPCPSLQTLSLDVCSKQECGYGGDRDLIIGAFCEDRVNYPPSGNPNHHPFPNLISMTVRVCCRLNHSGSTDGQPKNVETWKECASSILTRREGGPLEYIELVWDKFDLTVRYNKA